MTTLYYGSSTGFFREWTPSGGWSSNDISSSQTVRSIWGLDRSYLFAGMSHGASATPEIWFWDGLSWSSETLTGAPSEINQAIQIHGGGSAVFATLWRNSFSRIDVYERVGTSWTYRTAVTFANFKHGLYVRGSSDVWLSTQQSSSDPAVFWWNGSILQQLSAVTSGLPAFYGGFPADYPAVFEWQGQMCVFLNGGNASFPSQLWTGTFGGAWSKIDDVGSVNGQLSAGSYLMRRGQQWGVGDDGNLYLFTEQLFGVEAVLKLTPGGVWTEDTAVGSNINVAAFGVGGNPPYLVTGDRYYVPGVGWQTDTFGGPTPKGEGSFVLFADRDIQQDDTAQAVDSASVLFQQLIGDDEWIVLTSGQWEKPNKTTPAPGPDRLASQDGGTSVIAWDSQRRRVVFLTEPTAVGIMQAWDYLPSSNTWIQRGAFGGMPDIHYPTSASKDVGLAACFEGISNQVLIYALKRSDQTPTLWLWDASRITNITGLVSGLPTITEPQLVWDEDNQTCWLYGYSLTSGRPYEIYEYFPTSGNWVDRYVVSGPLGRRRGSGFAYDPLLQEVVLTHGGISPTLYADTWSFNRVSWTDRTPSGVEGTDYPEARMRTALVTSPNGKLYLVGGYAVSGAKLRDTWRWDGSTLTWSKLAPNSVTITDVNANMRAVGRWPSRPSGTTQNRVGVTIEISQVNEVVSSVDTVVKS